MSPRGAGPGFPTTRWTRILSSQGTPESRRALLGELLGIYWRPLYVLARRSGLSRPAAEDAVQGLWLGLLERDALGRLDEARGRLRGFLCVSLRNHLASLHDREQASKRGGAKVEAELDFEPVESALTQAPASPEQAFEREWASAVMQRALAVLRQEYESGERTGSYPLVLEVFGFGEDRPYRELASRHQMTVPQLKAFAHRARARFREIVEELVGDTVEHPSEVVAETRQLWSALGP